MACWAKGDVVFGALRRRDVRRGRAERQEGQNMRVEAAIALLLCEDVVGDVIRFSQVVAALCM